MDDTKRKRLQAAEDMLVAAAEERRAEGVRVINKAFGSSTGSTTCLCPFACLSGDVCNTQAEDAAAVGLTEDESWDVIAGIDGTSGADDEDCYDMGVRVALRLGL